MSDHHVVIDKVPAGTTIVPVNGGVEARLPDGEIRLYTVTLLADMPVVNTLICPAHLPVSFNLKRDNER